MSEKDGGVKRYWIDIEGATHEDEKDGDWVRLEDHEAAMNRLNKLLDKANLSNEYLESSLRICKDVAGSIQKQDAQRIQALESALKAKEEEIATLKEAMNVTVCVWCGHKGKKDALELLTHVQECSKHPLGKSLNLIEALELELEQWKSKHEFWSQEHLREMTAQLKDKDARIASLEAALRRIVSECCNDMIRATVQAALKSGEGKCDHEPDVNGECLKCDEPV